MFDLACLRPDPYHGPEVYEPNSAIRTEGDFLSEDFCVLGGEHFLVRCVLEIPVLGLEQKFGFGCWGSLKRQNFDAYVEHFDNRTMPGDGPWWSWLCNDLAMPGTEEPVGCWMFPQIGRQRPVLKVADEEHPLARMQEEGISPEYLLAIYAAHGHELRG